MTMERSRGCDVKENPIGGDPHAAASDFMSRKQARVTFEYYAAQDRAEPNLYFCRSRVRDAAFARFDLFQTGLAKLRC